MICERHKGKGLVARLLLPGAMRMACWISGRTAPVEGGMAPRLHVHPCYMLHIVLVLILFSSSIRVHFIFTGNGRQRICTCAR